MDAVNAVRALEREYEKLRRLYMRDQNTIKQLEEELERHRKINTFRTLQKYKNPKPTVDIIIELQDDDCNNRGIVLIQRKNEPFKGGWAFPGGFVDEGEHYAHAAVREAKEETSLDVKLEALFHVYSDPQRDPRGHTVSTVYIASAKGTPVAADDAANVMVADLVVLADMLSNKQLAFDHDKILLDYLTLYNKNQRPDPSV